MSAGDLNRLLAPRSIALIGGTWADYAAAASRAIGFDGELWRVHPTRESTAAQHYFRSVEELPRAPDAAFVAAPAREVPGIAAALARGGAGGFVCFAAGFSETATPEGERLTRELVAAAADLPFFGPNCYGLINFLRRRGALARPGRRAAPRARRRPHLPERHHRAQPPFQSTARCRSAAC